MYTHGNANINILDPDDPVNPANNFSGGQWPPDWEELFLSPYAVDFQQLNDGLPPVDPDSFLDDFKTGSLGINDYDWVFIANPADSVGIMQKEGGSSYSFYFDTPDSSLTVECYEYETDGWSGDWEKKKTVTLTPPAEGNEILLEASGILWWENLKSDFDYMFENFEIAPSGDGEKVDPNFHITGALVAINPDNPVPALSGIDDGPNAGNINIDIIEHSDEPDDSGSNVFIEHSSRYLKLLQSSNAYTGYQCVYWSEM